MILIMKLLVTLLLGNIIAEDDDVEIEAAQDTAGVRIYIFIHIIMHYKIQVNYDIIDDIIVSCFII